MTFLNWLPSLLRSILAQSRITIFVDPGTLSAFKNVVCSLTGIFFFAMYFIELTNSRFCPSGSWVLPGTTKRIRVPGTSMMLCTVQYRKKVHCTLCVQYRAGCRIFYIQVLRNTVISGEILTTHVHCSGKYKEPCIVLYCTIQYAYMDCTVLYVHVRTVHVTYDTIYCTGTVYTRPV